MKKQVIVAAVAALTVFGFSMCSQNKLEAVEEAVDSCAVLPEFPGGQDSLVAYFSSNINYPEKAQEAGLEGRVLVKFVVEKDGSISTVEVAESADSLLDAEALRVIEGMPAWSVGKNEEGEAVRVNFTLPVNFILDGAVDKCDVMPEFPGGMEACVKFLADNIKYPEACERDRIQGRVLVQMIIDEAGNVTEPTVIKSVDPLLDAEALRVVKAMPKWTAGQQDGKAIAVRYVVPFVFKLQ